MQPDPSSAATRSADTELDVTARVDVRATLPAGLEQPGDMIGRYKLIEPLGQGGFGSVWRAEQHEPIHREVALKVIKAGMDSREIIARFEAERQALALMDHPNIAAVLDAGTTESGRPFFAMELVKGVPLTDFCDAKKLTIRQRLELFIPVCQAVQHAHQKAILHRDLKPSNILVVEVDGKPVPKVIDFGIAKALGGSEEQALQASLARTQAGMIIGTPQYMSPEQAGAKPDLDTRSDIYTLGVILCELLTGDTPLSRETLRSAAMDEVMRMIREADPKRISIRMASGTELVRKTAEARSTDPGRLRQTLRGDLDWITLKALEKERERRYGSAAALAQDLRRHLNAEPVEAGPPSAAYRFRKLVQRNRLAVSAAAGMVFLLVAGIVVSTSQAVRARRAERATQERSDELRATLSRQYVDNGTRGLDSNNYPLAFYWFVRALELDEGHPTREKYHRMRVANTWRRMPRLTAILFHEAPLSHSEFSPDGKWIATSSYDKTARIWNAETGEPVGKVLQHQNYVYDVRFSPDGQLVATASADGTARVWDAMTGDPVTEPLAHANAVNHVEFSRDSTMLATACAGRDHYRPPPGGMAANPTSLPSKLPCAVVWHRKSGKVVPLKMLGGQPFTACFSEDGNFVATGDWQGDTLALWNPQTGEMTHGPLLQGPSSIYDSITIQVLISSDNRFLAAGSGENVTRVWDVGKKQIVGTLPKTYLSRSSRFLGDSHLEIEGKVWDFRTGQPVGKETKDKEGKSILPMPSHQQFFFKSMTGGVCLQDVSAGLDISSILPAGDSGIEPASQLSPDQRRMLLRCPDRRQWAAYVWDRVGDAPSSRPLWSHGGVNDAEMFGEGRNLVTAAYYEGEMALWDLEAEGRLLSRKRHSKVLGVFINHQQSELLSFGRDGACRRWVLPSGQLLGSPLLHDRWVDEAQYAPGGERLITIDSPPDGSAARLHGWLLSSGQECWPSVTVGGRGDLGISHDGRWAGVGVMQGHVQVIDTATGRNAAPLLKHDYWCKAPAFHPHRALVATPGGDQTVRIWEMPSGKPVTVLKHQGTVMQVRFTPDGSQLLAASSNGLVRWDTKTWTQMGSVIERGRDVSATHTGTEADWGALRSSGGVAIREFSSGSLLAPYFKGDNVRMDPQGRHIITWQRGTGPCRKWDITPDTRPVAQLRMLSQLMLTQETDAYGELTYLPGEVLRKMWESYKAESPEQLRFSDSRHLVWLEEEAARLHEGGFHAQELEVLTAAMSIRPNDPYLRGLRGEVAALIGDNKMASSDLVEVIAAGLASNHNWATWKAAHSAKPQKVESARALVDRMKREPKNGYLLSALGKLFMMAGIWKGAEDVLSRGIKLGCDDHAKLDRACCLIGMEQWADALKQLSEVIEDDPLSGLQIVQISLALKLNDPETAKKAYQEVVRQLNNKIVSLNPNGTNQLAWVQAVHLKSDPGKARSFAELAVKAEPKNAAYLTTLAAALLRTRSFDLAKERLEQAIAMQGDGGTWREWLFMALLQHELKKPAEAGMFLEKARKWHEEHFSKPTEYKKTPSWTARLNDCRDRMDFDTLLREAKSKIENAGSQSPASKAPQ